MKELGYLSLVFCSWGICLAFHDFLAFTTKSVIANTIFHCKKIILRFILPIVYLCQFLSISFVKSCTSTVRLLIISVAGHKLK